MKATAENTAAQIRTLILELLPPGQGENARIFGGEAAMDSLGLVNFLADLEYRLTEKFGRELVLASERAMSRKKSPFRDVAALTAYIEELLAA